MSRKIYTALAKKLHEETTLCWQNGRRYTVRVLAEGHRRCNHIQTDCLDGPNQSVHFHPETTCGQSQTKLETFHEKELMNDGVLFLL